jgi:hypothetical protein
MLQFVILNFVRSEDELGCLIAPVRANVRTLRPVRSSVASFTFYDVAIIYDACPCMCSMA